MALVIPNTFAAGAIIDPALVNADFDAIATKINGNLGNSDFNAGDPLAATKMAVSYQRMTAVLQFQSNVVPGWYSAGRVLAHFPLIEEGSPWVATDCRWFCADTGNGTGKFKVQTGAYSATGIWTSTADLIAETTLARLAAFDDRGNQGSPAITGTPYTIPWTGAAQSIGLVCSVSDIDACVVGPLTVVVLLKRQITA